MESFNLFLKNLRSLENELKLASEKLINCENDLKKISESEKLNKFFKNICNQHSLASDIFNNLHKWIQEITDKKTDLNLFYSFAYDIRLIDGLYSNDLDILLINMLTGLYYIEDFYLLIYSYFKVGYLSNKLLTNFEELYECSLEKNSLYTFFNIIISNLEILKLKLKFSGNQTKIYDMILQLNVRINNICYGLIYLDIIS